MKTKGTITKIGELKEAVSAQTGNVFRTRQIVLSIGESYYKDGQTCVRNHDYVYELTGDEAVKFSLEVGTNVSITYCANVREYGNNFYESKRIWSINLV